MQMLMRACLMLITLGGTSVWASDNLHFSGTLIAEPCTLDPNTTSINLDFGTVIDKYLYINTRTNSKPFDIRLLGCDTILGNSVQVTFSGTADSELPDLLAVSNGAASGIAIGIELVDGTLLPINSTAPAHQLLTGDNVLTFRGYVQMKPSAMQSHSITRGNFNAIATFKLDYL
ncbi:fimbrial protein [Enterobacter bugandensis]|uniref:fimbrial protein n=1 Tax=Enterobacter bugandensis TaxID=881260 RepID=UPI002003B3BF|nr:fimbrial protein [Enterobacter bugandensis]MCK6964552.1 type 1 fimbrial protein [Enterobacter bugandensis]